MGGFVLYYCFVICSLLLVLYGVGRFWVKPKRVERKLKQQGIAGRPYKLLIGDVKEFVRLITEAWSKPINLSHQIVQRVDPFTLDNVQKYRKISFCWAGTTPRLIIKDPELMTQVLSNKQGHFQKPPLNPLILILTRGLTTLEGEDWAKHRRIINPSFHLEKLKVMIPEFATSCRNMIQQWNQMIGSQESCELDVWPQFQKLTADVISRAKNKRRRRLNTEITAMLRNVIEGKANALKTGKSRVDDLLGLLLQYCENENESSTRTIGLTIEEVIEECKAFYLAGQETTSSLLTWTVVVLAMHPDWQEKARQEVYKLVTMILYEVLRLYPPAIAQYQHTYKQTKIGEISVPAGVDIILPTLLVHHDPELWGNDVDEFKPGRFSEGVSKASNNDQLAFFPFGWGPRSCIGQNFAMLEAKLALAMILPNFSFQLSPSYSHAPHTVMILQPQHGAQIILHKL
ncbi:putative cytochrome P450 superfamily protein [Citrus sinensis]|nr:putative cytochrome P450 superfamily protein [Citrus sinensis]